MGFFVSWLKKRKEKKEKKKAERKSKGVGVFFSPGVFSQPKKTDTKIRKFKSNLIMLKRI